MPITISPRFVGNVFVIECGGRLVAGPEVESLQAALDEHARQFTRLVLDVGAVDRMDSTGLGLLVRSAARLRQAGGDMRLAAAPVYLVKLLELTKLTSLLVTYPDQEDAILSFLKQKSGPKAPKKQGPRVLFLDQSPDLCAFVGTVLTQNGYDVQATNFFRDARILIQVNSVDYILVGPGSPMLTAQSILDTLQSIAPKASAIRLDVDFGARDAQEAADVLLNLFKTATPPKSKIESLLFG